MSDLPEPNPSFVGKAISRVMRLDDNGNQVELTKTTSRCEAESVAAKYEARGHKQMYWVEAISQAETAKTIPEAPSH
jgi:hypothetical protein